jgi:predicted nucleic acid-binding Zn ribbon protein
MTAEEKFCQSCGSAINKDSVFCNSCGRPVRLYEKNIIHRLNERINLLSLLLGFLSSAIFFILSSFFFSLFLSNGMIDFIMYMGLTTMTAIFFGGLTVGLIGCSDYNDAKSNSMAFVLIIMDVLAIVFSVSFSTALGISSALSSVFGGPDSTASSIATDTSLLSTSQPATNYSAIFIIEILIFAILSVAAGIGGCYLGVLLKNFIADD